MDKTLIIMGNQVRFNSIFLVMFVYLSVSKDRQCDNASYVRNYFGSLLFNFPFTLCFCNLSVTFYHNSICM